MCIEQYFDMNFFKREDIVHEGIMIFMLYNYFTGKIYDSYKFNITQELIYCYDICIYGRSIEIS